ncbi:hypothetical protein A6E15_17250 [Natrinema saccharevitans]|uniref:Uncharacterized protein n=1 Tax=Natrinema saccharevitans TaxID=301967 RepID=A0A1S8AQS4_9EURY|nr:hypothetical protein [Natrinema saccharevitans]OLZ39158.1 hypothetical protein A6E15_17250 [Natrinema saccharevitans]
MPYLDPELILDRFAAFTREEVRPAVTDDEFVHAQVGSMASTLQFLAGDVGGREAAVRVQRRTLRESLTELESALDRHDVGSSAVRTAVDDARSDLETADGPTRDVEETLVAVADDVLTTIDAELDGDAAAVARRPLYDFLRTRVDEQLRLLGREDDE